MSACGSALHGWQSKSLLNKGKGYKSGTVSDPLFYKMAGVSFS